MPPGRLSGAAIRNGRQITEILARTFFQEWARVGYPGALSLDAVARKAGVGKAALYRRWRSKADMARDLVSQLTASVPARLESGDCGSLEADLYAMGLAGRRLMRHPLVRRIMPDLYAALDREPRPGRGAAAQRGGEPEEGQDPDRPRRGPAANFPDDVDRALATDVVLGPLYWRLVMLGERATRQQIRTLARMTAAAIAAAGETGPGRGPNSVA